MFIYNLKLNKKLVTMAFICISLVIICLIIMYSLFIIFFKSTSTCDSNQKEIIDLNETNYTNVLKSANENIDSYVGKKVRITGYVYRLIDFDDTQFVVARDMKFNESSNSIIVGFLCESKEASKYADGTWVEVIGTIKKGRFTDELAVLDVVTIKETDKPENIFVNPPDKTYIPTTNIF
ncbi:MAG: hypothetical protein IJK18_04325 [Clostridia bacterium]|nr:hypothetical protein [Clostridia bacterium]